LARYSFAQLEGLWVQAGGPKAAAPVMAAIALAESAGNSDARNPSGASGLWQILGLPFPGDPFNPQTNAKMAVSKYRSQGLTAWETYTTGAYRKFLPAGTPPAPAGGGGGARTTGLLGIPGQIAGTFGKAGTALDWLLSPSHWVRIFAFISGAGLVLSGSWMLTHAGGQV
jgi:hypothetical protein